MQGYIFEADEQKRAPEKSSAELSLLFDTAKVCRQCSLAESRLNFVFGEGNHSADLVVIGEAPGAEEDASGRPFVGRSGQLLDKILLAASFRREEVYICNILKCRPPGNRNPLSYEITSCTPWLLKQLQIIKPKVILVLGKVAANTLLGNTLSLGTMRGKLVQWRGYDCFITYHPAALLRNPNWKKECWEDIQVMMRHYATICDADKLTEKRVKA
ncbi:MAG: uracil-DNA glycosylase [Chlorobium sp.]|nr:MAG: uracil-DNA glycosylase [Chlorobium sp.]